MSLAAWPCCPEAIDTRGRHERRKSEGNGDPSSFFQRAAKTSQHVAALASLSRGPEQPLCEAGKVKPILGEIPRRRRCKAKNIPGDA